MVFVGAEELSEELDTFGLEANDEVLGELKRICDAFSCNAESIVTKWVAFSHSSGLSKHFIDFVHLELYFNVCMLYVFRKYTTHHEQAFRFSILSHQF